MIFVSYDFCLYHRGNFCPLFWRGSDQLPESEKTIILVEKGARLTQASPSAGRLSAGMGIHFTGDTESYYIKVKASYTFTIPSISFDALRTRPLLNTDVGKVSTGVNGKIHPKDKQPQWYSLTSKDKEYLINTYLSRYPELTLSAIPDIVELISNGKGQEITLPSVYSKPVKDDNFFTIRFIIENKPYWIESDKVLHLKGQDGQLTSSISYWNNFPLSFDSRSPSIQEKTRTTVCYPRAVSLSLLAREGLIAIDEEKAKWVQVTALDEQTFPIQGWVNIKQNVQAHIKLVSPWHWTGFETIEEKATVGELSDKLGKNNVAKLDLADYTPAMRALHQILTGTLIYSTQRKKDLPPPTFTDSNLKEGLRRSWTAEQIGHLLVRYESEWYADAALSKWNEIDELFEEEKRQQKALIEEGLDNLGITRPYQRDFAMEKVDEAHEHVKSNWQREKEERIKPSLWWQQVAQAQAQVQNQTTSTEQSDADTNSPKLTNLSTDGKAWFIHPIAMIDYFNVRSTEIIFPLKVKPINNFDMQFGKKFNWTKNDNQTMFGSNRSGGKRKHAGRDLYTEPNAEIVAVCDGVVLDIRDFYCKTHQITVKHHTNSGREFIIRYGEVDKSSIKNLKVGDSVKQGAILAKTGKLLNNDDTPLMVLSGKIIYMLHLEYYSGESGLDLKKPLSNKANKPYERRKDLLDPLELLKQGYRNSFGADPQ
ncbi:M23 family metallopeptidase [Gilliamella sp. Bif1-4]|uniref:M23 family metallopeptidase n=1 Tax=Gilliamella sp. Bif1-4 TaxID=3120233 RepID=UPI0011472601|nr:M23 family metallopeptidase [Gilliamella apicola]